MPVPETAMDKNEFLAARKNDIRFAGKTIAVQAVAITHFMKEATNRKLGARIAAFDRAHGAASLLRRFH